MATREIARVSGLARDELYARYVEAGEPVVLEDAARDWPATTKWTTDHLAARAGDRMVQLRAIEPRKVGPLVTTTRTQRMRDYLLSLPAMVPGDPYLAEQPVKNVLPDLVEDIGTIRYSKTERGELSIMLGARSYAPLHYHTSQEAVSHQVAGERRFLLLPPSETAALDPMPKGSKPANFARRIIKEEEIPSLREEAYETTLRPGEAIYIPRHWWHAVYGPSSLSILLVDFFHYTLAQPRKNPVTERIESAARESLEDTEALLETAEGAERLFCLQVIVRCYQDLEDGPSEIRALERLERALPPDDESTRASVRKRMAELEAATTSLPRW